MAILNEVSHQMLGADGRDPRRLEATALVLTWV